MRYLDRHHGLEVEEVHDTQSEVIDTPGDGGRGRWRYPPTMDLILIPFIDLDTSYRRGTLGPSEAPATQTTICSFPIISFLKKRVRTSSPRPPPRVDPCIIARYAGTVAKSPIVLASSQCPPGDGSSFAKICEFQNSLGTLLLANRSELFR